jgi:hypothetical protein
MSGTREAAEEDLFGDAHALEERHIASGFEEGKR